jgi:VCBS repeat protein
MTSRISKSIIITLFLLICLPLAIADAAQNAKAKQDLLNRIQYNNPGLAVDLGVGLWAWPLPLDFDGDGDNDLLVNTQDKPYNGLYYFENTSGNVKYPVFKPGVRISGGSSNVQISYVGDQYRILTPGKEYPDYKTKGLSGGVAFPYKQELYAGRSNHWRLVDYDGDGVTDLIIGASDWREYGWDNAFNDKGEWIRGPLHGYVYFIKNLGDNDNPKYGEAVKILADGEPIDVYGMPSPNFADWDNDGDLDLICGEFLDRFTYFENTGSRHEPRYATGRFLSYQNQTIKMDLEMIIPTAIDWDNDGDVDLVIGQEDGRVALVENTGKIKDKTPQFLPPKFFQQEATNVKFGALVTPFSVDWDNDGDQDLICGNTAGYIGFIENLDGAKSPRWAEAVYLKAEGQAIHIQAGYNGSIQGPAEAKWGYTVLNVADWNNNGLLDIIANSIVGEIIWFENIGTQKSPKLKASQTIDVEWQGKPPKPEWHWWNPKGKQLVSQWRTSPVIYDLNHDGLNDLIMLDHEGYFSFFERKKENGRLTLLPGKRIFQNETGDPLRLNDGKAGKSGRRKFVLVDWDMDGHLDILINSRSIDFMRNIATKKGEYKFKNLGQVHPHRLAGHTTCPAIVDWDKNNIPDLLIGAEDGHFYYFENPNTAKK